MLTDAFQPDGDGYIRHWVHTGAISTPYDGSESKEEAMRREVVPETPGPTPLQASLGGPGPNGTSWRFHYPGRNVYLDQGAFHHRLGHLSLFASTLFVSNKSVEIPARIWTANTVDLWANTDHRVRYTRSRRKAVSASHTFTLNLNPGQNRITVQLQELAVRDTPFLFALQLLDRPDQLRIALPGHPAATSSMVKACGWLDEVSVTSTGLASDTKPPFPVEVTLDRPDQSQNRSWLQGEKSVSWHEDDVFSCRIEMRAEEQRLRRGIEIPGNLKLSRPGEDLETYREGYLESIASAGSGEPARSLFAVLARKTLDTSDKEADEAALQDGLDHVAGRLDCADFRLGALLRLYALDWGHPEQRNLIRMTALGFRYWSDETGTDAMAMGSENHALLFHGCQHIAGILFPDETFTASDRTGKEQREIGRERCMDWLNDRHAHGFKEYLSGTYSPITAAALLNLVDFSDDKEIKTSASTLLDRLLRQLAEHTYDGVTTGPQGRIYRTVLYPHTSASQGLLSYMLGEDVVESVDPWSAFAATSTYKPPTELASLVSRPIKRTYHQSNHCIHLNKTDGYMVSSVLVDDESPKKPGKNGYQELLWHATLAGNCHVFVNHPGTWSDAGISRPGYWYGKSILPRVAQQESTVYVTYEIPGDHPIPFTHAHWPADAFDEQSTDDEGWYLGRCGNGYVGIWCSEPLTEISEVLSGRDLVARARRVGWICKCADSTEFSDFGEFRTACLTGAPSFDSSDSRLHWDGRQII